MHSVRSLPIVLILLAALAARLVAAYGVNEYLEGSDQQFLVEGDANGYWELGTDIAFGRDYAYHLPPRRILRMPGLPVLLATSIHMFGESIPAARYLLAVVGTLGCWLTYLLGRRLVDRRTGLVAAGITAVSPLLVGNSVLVLSEGPFSVAMLLSLLALERLLRGLSGQELDGARLICRSVLVGLSIALATYFRPGWLPWMAIAAASVLVCTQCALRLRLASQVIMLLVLVSALLPWGMRNHSVSGHFVLTTLWSGPSLYDGLNPEATGESNMEFVDRDGVFAGLSEFEADRYYRRAAWDFAISHKGRTVVLGFQKLGRVWNPVPAIIPADQRAVRIAFAGFYIAFFLLTLRGLWKLRRNKWALFFVVAPVFLTCALHMVFVGSVRYRLPLEFLLAMAVAVAVLPSRNTSPNPPAVIE